MKCCDFSNLSVQRKIVLSVAGVLYSLAILGNARLGMSAIIGVTLAFAAIIGVLSLWIK